MKNLQDSKFIKSFSDAFRVWLKANRTRVILLVMLFLLGISFFAGGKIFSDSSEKNPNEGTGPHTDLAGLMEEDSSGSEESSERESEEKESGSNESCEKESDTKEQHSETEILSEQITDFSSEEQSVESSSEEQQSETTSISESSLEEHQSEEPPIPKVSEKESITENTPSSEPVTEEPQSETINETESESTFENQEGTVLCTITVSCIRVYDDPDLVPAEKWQVIPEDGMILPPTEIRVKEGSTVYQVLREVCKQNGILLDASVFSAYVRGIGNLYEFDLGRQSGWMYSVNGKYPSVGCGSYHVEEGDTIEWNYTCHRGDLQPEGEEENGSNLK